MKKQRITVDQIVATTATFIKGGERIQLIKEEPLAPKRKFHLTLTVLFEDEYLAAIHKPAGILVSGNHFKTIANALQQNLRASTLADATTPQAVHRLDYATTGILLVGKTRSGIRALNQLFELRAIQKTYYAITMGTMRAQGEIKFKIEGKESHTNYSLLSSVPSERFEKLNLVQLQPLTGRRHQLRKHLLHIGNPILGDSTYSPEKLLLKGKGLYLHAYKLEFEHPFTKENLCLTDSLPKKFKKIFGPLKF